MCFDGMLSRRSSSGSNTTAQVMLAVLFLLAGVLTYSFARLPDDAFLVPRLAIEISPAWRDWVPALTGSLPTFTHTVAFALLTAALVLPGQRGALFACLLWLGIETLFEAGQAPSVSMWLSGYVPAWFSRVPILDHAGSYFRGGTFDPNDLAAAVLGALIAYWILLFSQRKMT
jgi:hypothetical protein